MLTVSRDERNRRHDGPGRSDAPGHLRASRGWPAPRGELADELPVSRPAVSQHLKVLKQAGLVVDHKRGTRRLYQVDPQAVADLRAYFDSFWDQALAGFRDATDVRGDTVMQQTAGLAVRQSVTVDVPPERAFAVFTEGLASWWPLATHAIGAQPAVARSSSRGPAGAGTSAPRTAASATGPCAGPGATAPSGAGVGDLRRLAARRGPRHRDRGPLPRRARRSHSGRARAPRVGGLRRPRAGDARHLRLARRLGGTARALRRHRRGAG